MNAIYRPKYISLVLASLLMTDIVLTVLGFAFPHVWFETFHGTAYNDPEGFLRRCAANWLMFGVLQAVALVSWKKALVWLAVVAGARFSDVLTDLSYFYFSENMTTVGAAGLLLAGPMNLAAGLYLMGAYRSLNQAENCADAHNNSLQARRP